MTDQSMPKPAMPKSEPVRPQESGKPSGGAPITSNPATAPVSSPTYVDPARRTFGDKTDDAGEGHKGPQADRSTPSNQDSQPTQKAPRPSAPSKAPETKLPGPQSGGLAAV